MKKEDLIQAIENGAIISRTEHMIFKRGKLKRGSNIKYKCDQNTITESQFDAVRDILGRNKSMLLGTRLYQHKKFD